MAMRDLPDIYIYMPEPQGQGHTHIDQANPKWPWYIYLIKNSQAVKKGAAPKKAMVKKDVKSKVAAKKWL